MTFDYAVHSSLLIHWTGLDIDEKYDPNWHMRERSETPCPKLEEEYLERLLNILRHGLWMTAEPKLTIKINEKSIEIPEVSRICFTELKLSNSRTHAKKYGRLGVGLKRPFVFRHGGRPVTYYGRQKYMENDFFLKNCAENLGDKSLLHYFKAMNSSDGQPNYDFYAESEWRVIYTNDSKIVNPRLNSNPELTQYFASLPDTAKDKLCYLLPLDGWMSCITYPSVSIKNKAQKDKQIRDEIERIKEFNKESKKDHANQVEGSNWPVEMDLDLCRHF